MEGKKSKLIKRAQKSTEGVLSKVDPYSIYLYKEQIEMNINKIQDLETLKIAESIIEKLEKAEKNLKSLKLPDLTDFKGSISLSDEQKEKINEIWEIWKNTGDFYGYNPNKATGLLASNVSNILECFRSVVKKHLKEL